MQEIRPQLSIIIEWENVKLSDMDRCREMLRVISRQIPEYFGKHAPGVSTETSPAVEILFLHDPAAFAASAVEDIVAAELPRSTPHYRWRIISEGRGGYFGVKNIGANLARGELLVFLDSDLIPEDGWLEAMLSPVRDPEVKVVAGYAYVTPEDFLSRVFALIWFFPLRTDVVEIRPTKYFFANSVLFRRDTYMQFPFEPIPGTSRGACVLLARRLERAGVKMLLNTAARAGHPPPVGMRAFLRRGIAQGRDELLMNRTPDLGGKGTIFHSVARISRGQARASRNLLLRHGKVGLPFWQVPAALMISFAFTFLLTVGDIGTRLFPETMKANFHI